MNKSLPFLRFAKRITYFRKAKKTAMDYKNEDQLSELGLQLDLDARQQLFDTSKWAKFISIVVFVGCGLALLIGAFAGSALNSVFRTRQLAAIFGGQTFLVFMAILFFAAVMIATVYFFLFNFSVKLKQGLLTENTQTLNGGLRSLKIYFIITTIIAFISLLSTLYNAFIG